MSVWEAVVKGLFALADTVLGMALLVFLLWAFMRAGSRMFGGWGQPSGDLFFLDPRRIWCRHRVSYYGQGTAGLWALWCAACGKKVNRK